MAPESSEVVRRALTAACARHLESGLVAGDLLESMRCYRTDSRGSPCLSGNLECNVEVIDDAEVNEDGIIRNQQDFPSAL